MSHIRYNPSRELRHESNPYRVNPDIQRLAQEYVVAASLPPIQPTPYVKVDEALAKDIAAYFDMMPSKPADPLVREAYQALVNELRAQLAYVNNYVELLPYGDDVVNPYPDSPAMMEDIFKNHELRVYDGGSDHALLTREENWIFRGVHDFFGHAAHGFAFGPRGEENAWVEHCKMFTPVARWALSTESRGQNSNVNFGKYADLPPNKRPYAVQKANLLPVQFCIRPEFEAAYEPWPQFQTASLAEVEVASNPPPKDYHDIAHGMSEGVLWLYSDERIQTSPTSSGTHASIWGDEAARKCWRGRYEPESNRLSIAPPERLLKSPTPPQHLIDRLEEKFGQAEMYSFNPRAQRVASNPPAQSNPLAQTPRRFRRSGYGATETRTALAEMLGANWGALKQRTKELGGAEYLPKHKKESGQLWLLPEIQLKDAPLDKRMKREYGCGFYGCVYQTSVPGVVFKITTDKTEADFIALLLDWQLNRAGALPGMTEFYGIWQLEGDLKGHNAYAIWREESIATGFDKIRAVFKREDADEDLFMKLSNLRNWLMSRYMNAATSYGQSELERWLRLEIDTARSAGEDMIEILASTLLTIAEHGVSLQDVHYDNIGLVKRARAPRRDGDWPWWQPVITDPGHAKALVSGLEHVKPEMVDVGEAVASNPPDQYDWNDPREVAARYPVRRNPWDWRSMARLQKREPTQADLESSLDGWMRKYRYIQNQLLLIDKGEIAKSAEQKYTDKLVEVAHIVKGFPDPLVDAWLAKEAAAGGELSQEGLGPDYMQEEMSAEEKKLLRERVAASRDAKQGDTGAWKEEDVLTEANYSTRKQTGMAMDKWSRDTGTRRAEGDYAAIVRWSLVALSKRPWGDAPTNAGSGVMPNGFTDEIRTRLWEFATYYRDERMRSESHLKPQIVEFIEGLDAAFEGDVEPDIYAKPQKFYQAGVTYANMAMKMRREGKL